MRSRFTQRLKGWLTWVRNIILTLLLIALGEWLPLMTAVQRFQEDHLSMNQALTVVTLGMTILGTLLLAFSQFLVRVPNPRIAARAPTNKSEVKAIGPGWFFSGKMISAGFTDEARFWRVRKAFRDGEWWKIPRWRRLTLMMLGGILLFYGLFGLLFLMFSPGLKFFLFLVVVYATIRTVYGFIVDRPFRENNEDTEDVR